MKKIKVASIRKFVTEYASIVNEDADSMEIAKNIVKDPKTRSVYVVNKNEILVGLIPVSYLVQYLFYEYVPDEFLYYQAVKPLEEVKAKDIMIPPVFVKEDDTLETAFKKMASHNIRELPVVNDDMKIIGDLNILELIIAWIRMNS